MFDGRCVNTIVLIRPKRAASRDASSAEMPGEDVRPEEDAAQRRRAHAEAQVEPVRGEALDDEAAAERIQREQAGQLQHDAARSPDPKQRPAASGDSILRHLRRRREPVKQQPPAGLPAPRRDDDRPIAR